MTLPELKSGIAQLLALANTQGAIQLLSQYAEEHSDNHLKRSALSLQSRYSRLRSDNARGVLSQSDLEIGINRINDGIIGLIDQVSTSPGTARRSILWWASAALLLLGIISALWYFVRENRQDNTPAAVQTDSTGSKGTTARLTIDSTDADRSRPADSPGKSSNSDSAPEPPSKPVVRTKYIKVILELDAPWRNAAVLVDGVPATILETYDYKKVIRVPEKNSNQKVTMRLGNGRECIVDQVLTSGSTLFFTCP